MDRQVFRRGGCRRIKTFEKKEDAEKFNAVVRVEIGQGIHTPDSESVSIADASKLWLTTCRQNGLERLTVQAYEQHVNLHIRRSWAT